MSLPMATPLVLAGEAPLISQQLARAYDSSLIRGSGNVDLSHIAESSDRIAPGTYPMDLLVNGDALGKQDVLLHKEFGQQALIPCITVAMLERMRVAKFYLDTLESQNTTCVNLEIFGEQAATQLDLGRLSLEMLLPQAYLEQTKRGFVDPSYWDYGVTAGFANYQANLRRDINYDQQSDSLFVGMNSGINLGTWRLRNESNLTRTQRNGTRIKSNRTFLQRDIVRLKSQASLGELYSNANLFNSIRFRGIQLSSDEGMLADSERGYAPIIRGVAESNATIEVRQNGFLLSSTQVPPGPFALNDIYPSGSNGDLEVTVIEADGRHRVFIQPFSSLPLMVRQGYLRYSVEMGQYKSNSNNLDTPMFTSLAGTYGLFDNLSLSAGMQVANQFSAFSVGLGGNTPVGALSLDLTQSNSRVQGQSRSGRSIRALYAKTLPRTNTTVTLAAYRYSTYEYRTFDNHVNDLYTAQQSYRQPNDTRSRSRFDMTVNQTIGKNSKYGNFYINAQREAFWNARTMDSISAGYGHTYKGVSYNLSYSKSHESYGGQRNRNDNLIMLSVSIPLGQGGYAPSLSSSYDYSDGGSNLSTSLYGYVPGAANTNYSAQLIRNNRNRDTSGSLGVSTTLPAVNLGASYGKGKNFSSYSINASGAIVAHAEGLNFSRNVGDGFALVHVKGIEGVGIGENLPTTAANGYTVYPNIQPYRFNTIRLDSGSLGADVELDVLSKSVVPHRGAIVRAEFHGVTGRRLQLQLFDDSGSALPMGAKITDKSGRNLSIVDQNGQALMLVTEDQGIVDVQWDNAKQSCRASYALPKRDPTRYYDKLSAVCKN